MGVVGAAFLGKALAVGAVALRQCNLESNELNDAAKSTLRKVAQSRQETQTFLELVM